MICALFTECLAIKSLRNAQHCHGSSKEYPYPLQGGQVEFPEGWWWWLGRRGSNQNVGGVWIFSEFNQHIEHNCENEKFYNFKLNWALTT